MRILRVNFFFLLLILKICVAPQKFGSTFFSPPQTRGELSFFSLNQWIFFSSKNFLTPPQTRQDKTTGPEQIQPFLFIYNSWAKFVIENCCISVLDLDSSEHKHAQYWCSNT